MREVIEKRLEELKAMERKLFADFNAVHGAVQEYEYLLSLKEEPKEDK